MRPDFNHEFCNNGGKPRFFSENSRNATHCQSMGYVFPRNAFCAGIDHAAACEVGA